MKTPIACHDIGWLTAQFQVATGRKTATLGVIGLRTDGPSSLITSILLLTEVESSNDLWEKHREDAYAHLSVFQEISQYVNFSNSE
jgi:ATP-dependent DNA helicase 2 subunit 2